jgi:hypothetical protein
MTTITTAAAAPLAAQAHALRAAAAFIERTAMAHLTVAVRDDGTITIFVEADAGPAAARARAITVLAARTGAGGLARAGCATWECAYAAAPGRIDGHDVRITTYISKTHTAGEPA